MFDFIQKFIYSFISWQRRILSVGVKNSNNRVFSNTTTKRAYDEGASLVLSTKTEKNKEKLRIKMTQILNKYENNPEKLLRFVEKNGTQVYKIPYAEKVLRLIGLETGFIPSVKGSKALYLTVMLSILSNKQNRPSVKCESIFVLSNKNIDTYALVHQLHKWCAMKLDLPGFDYKSQENFQKFLYAPADEKIKELSIDEILGLKEAIARDVESINFIVDLAKSSVGSKNVLKKMISGGASI